MKFLELLKRNRLVAAHRGARSIAPENTLSSLKKSIGKCDFVEIDVQLSKDGVVIVMHDDTLQRTTDVTEMDIFKNRALYRVCDFTYDELLTLDYGSWFEQNSTHKEPLLTLKIALEFIKKNGMFINVEIKDMSNFFEDKIVVDAVIKEIEDAGVRERVLLSSFRHEYLKETKHILSDVPTAALFEESLRDDLSEYLRSLEVEACNLYDGSVDEKRVKMLREAGFLVGVYTVNDPNRAKELFEMGVNYIFSDSLDRSLKKVCKMTYEKLQKALETLDIVTRITQAELKEKYLRLSKMYHPDMPEGDAKKFKEINEAYKLINSYIQNYRFSFDEDEFYAQNPFSRKSKDWFYNF